MAIIDEPLTSKWRDRTGGIVGVKLFSQKGARAHRPAVQRWPPVKQAFARNTAAIVTAWRDLSGPEQDAWHTFGADFPGVDKYGDAINWGGFQWYTRCNSRLLLAGRARIDAPPADDQPTYTPGFSCSFHEPSGAFFLDFLDDPVADEWFIVQYRLHCPLSLGAAPLPMTHGGIFEFPSFNSITVAIIPGPWPIPERHWVRGQGGDGSGRVSAAFTGSVLTGV